MTMRVEFDDEMFRQRLDKAMRELVPELDNPSDSDTTTLADVFATDQSIEATAGMVGRYYERLRASGIPKAAAVEMAQTYNAMVVAQHFGVEISSMYGVGPMYEGE